MNRQSEAEAGIPPAHRALGNRLPLRRATRLPAAGPRRDHRRHAAARTRDERRRRRPRQPRARRPAPAPDLAHAPAQPAPPPSIDAKVMAERSLKAGFIRDALKYLQLAQEDDPADFAVMLKLGWTYNLLHNDRQAIRWFDLARKSSDPKIAKEAATAYRNLRARPRNLPHHRLDVSRSTPPAGAISSLTPRSRPNCTCTSRFIPMSACASSAIRAAPSARRTAASRRSISPKAPLFPASAWPPTSGTACWAGPKPAPPSDISPHHIAARLPRRRFVHQGLRPHAEIRNRRPLLRNQRRRHLRQPLR